MTSFGRRRALKLLLEHQFDITTKDDRSQSVLHLAATFGLEDAVGTIITASGRSAELLDGKERLHCR